MMDTGWVDTSFIVAGAVTAVVTSHVMMKTKIAGHAEVIKSQAETVKKNSSEIHLLRGDLQAVFLKASLEIAKLEKDIHDRYVTQERFKETVERIYDDLDELKQNVKEVLTLMRR